MVCAPYILHQELDSLYSVVHIIRTRLTRIFAYFKYILDPTIDIIQKFWREFSLNSKNLSSKPHVVKEISKDLRKVALLRMRISVVEHGYLLV